jgi:hypothetical protein
MLADDKIPDDLLLFLLRLAPFERGTRTLVSECDLVVGTRSRLITSQSIDFSGSLASRNPNTGNNSKPIGFQNRFDAFDKRKNNRGFEHENNFQEVNQQNSSTRFFF